MEKRKPKLDDCRLCFSSTNVIVYIGQHIDRHVSIVDKIQYCTSLIVHVDDDFPQKICITCAETLDLIYNFKSKAIACDMELSRNVYKDINFAYIQVSNDPLNMTYKLYLEEQNSPTIDTNGKTTVYIDENASMIKEIMNNDGKKSIEKRLNGNSDIYQGSKTNNQKKSTSVVLKRNSDESLFDNNKHNSKQMKIENEKRLNGNSDIYQGSKTNNQKKSTSVVLQRNPEKSLFDNKKHNSKQMKIENEKRLNGNSDIHQGSKTNNQKKSTSVVRQRNPDKSLFGNNKHNSKKMKIENEKPLAIVKNGKVVYYCGECRFETVTIMDLVHHRARFHLDLDNIKGLYCPTCYKSSRLFEQHFSMSNRLKWYICIYCERRFTNKSIFDRHLKYHQSNTPLVFQCAKCNAHFDTIEKMENNFVIHYANPINKFKCDHCDYTFLTYADKITHTNIEHLIEIVCGICHVVLPTEEAMDKHNSSVH